MAFGHFEAAPVVHGEVDDGHDGIEGVDEMVFWCLEGSFSKKRSKRHFQAHGHGKKQEEEDEAGW